MIAINDYAQQITQTLIDNHLMIDEEINSFQQYIRGY